MKYFGIIIGIVLVSLGISNGKLPSTIQLCSRNDPDLAKCVIKSVNNLQPRLATGRIADDFLVPALEPLKIDTIKIERGTQFRANFANIIAKGASNFKIDNLRVNFPETSFEILLTLPRLDIVGKYDIKMKILLVDFTGQGDLQGTFLNTRALIKIRGRKYQKNGQTYVKFDTFGLRIKNGPTQLKLSNLFKGNKNLEEIGNRFINDNVQTYLDEINPGLEKSLAQHFTNVANQIVGSASLEEAFPDVAPRYN
ncbi:unnamed protein product [Diamesa serratosioi]